MRSRFSAKPLAGALSLLALASVTTLFVHGETVRYGFDYDDYYFLRPHAAEDVIASLSGPWDLTGVMVKFYRPLTVAFSALRFELFGLNAVAHHTVSLTFFILAALMTARLVRRSTGRVTAAIIATLYFVSHPAMPYSLTAWITNQMHLLQILVVLGAMLWWDAVRRRGLTWWLPLLVFGSASFLIKEDGVMLMPTIVVLHEIRRRTIEPDLPRTHVAFAAMAILLVAGLMMWRSHVLGEIGGYTRLSVDKAWVNVSTALSGVYRLVPADRPWQPAASWFATLLPIVALAAWKWISPGARFCVIAGVAIALLFSLPFVFVAKPEQVYLLALGFSITLTGASLGLLDLSARAPMQQIATAGAALIIAAGAGWFAIVSRDITRDFAPFGPIVLSHDDIVRTWGFLPPELGDYLVRKREPAAPSRVSSNPLDEITVVTYNTHGRDVTPDGVPYMWMDRRRSEIHVIASTRTITIPLRHAIEAFREPAHVRIEADGRLVDELELKSSEWRHSTIALRASDVPAISRLHRIRITIDKVWRPSEVIPGSSDGRLLGLQVGTPVLR